MASIEESIYTQLSGHGGLSALVGTRIRPVTLGQDEKLPAVTFFEVSASRFSASGSDVGVVRKRFQISAWGASAPSARDVATQIRLALQRWNGTVGGIVIQDTYIENELDIYDPATEVYHRPVDVEIFHEE